MKKPMQGLEALQLILSGETVVAYERYYKLNTESNTVQYSDDKHTWKDSSVSLNDFIKEHIIPIYKVVE